MNLLSNPGKAIHGVLTLIAFLCALVVSYIASWSFAIDAPVDSWEPGFYLSRIIFAVILVATVTLFISLFGVLSRRRIFPWLSIAGSAFLLAFLLRYAWNVTVMQFRDGGLGSDLARVLPIVVFQIVVLVLSVIKLKQLRVPR
jgi:hypothetical protein